MNASPDCHHIQNWLGRRWPRFPGVALAVFLGVALAPNTSMSGGEPGEERVNGRYVGPGVTCPQFQMESGETISLSGVYDRDLTPNSPVMLTGKWQRFSTCMQGRDFRVSEIDPAD